MGLLPPAVKLAFQNETIQIARLVELDFTFGVERYWSGIHELQYDSKTWYPTGNAGSVTPLESSQELKANGVDMSIFLPMDGGLQKPRANFQDVSASEYKGLQAREITAFFDTEFQNVIHTIERRYAMDSLSYIVDPKQGASITLRCESELLSKGKRRVKRWTDTQQRNDHPGDLFFQFLSYLSSNVQVKWGTSGAFFQ